MDDLAEKITDSELEVMKLLWASEEPQSITEIREALQESRGWEATTIKTLVSRLLGKGVIGQEKRAVFHYFPLLSEKEYKRWSTDRLIKRLYKGSARDLVAALVDSEGLSRQDIDELRQLFKVED